MYSHMWRYPSRRPTTPFSAGAVKELRHSTQDMSSNHLHRTQPRVQQAHIALRPVEALVLLRVDQPDRVESILASLSEREKSVEKHSEEDALVCDESEVGAADQDLLDPFFLCRTVVRVLLSPLLQTSHSFLRWRERVTTTWDFLRSSLFFRTSSFESVSGRQKRTQRRMRKQITKATKQGM